MTRTLTPYEIDQIARAAHEVNRSWCRLLGDTSQVAWEEAPEWQKASCKAGVLDVASGELMTPERAHESWKARKRAEGWTYGPVKDEANKTHPCIVESYSDLPFEQQYKDTLFHNTVKALVEAAWRIPQ